MISSDDTMRASYRANTQRVHRVERWMRVKRMNHTQCYVQQTTLYILILQKDFQKHLSEFLLSALALSESNNQINSELD